MGSSTASHEQAFNECTRMTSTEGQHVCNSVASHLNYRSRYLTKTRLWVNYQTTNHGYRPNAKAVLQLQIPQQGPRTPQARPKNQQGGRYLNEVQQHLNGDGRYEDESNRLVVPQLWTSTRTWTTGQGEVERPPAIQIRDLRPKYPEHISHTDQGTHHIQGR